MKVRFKDIPEDGLVTYVVGKKERKEKWYNVYKFTQKQEEEWEKWALAELRRTCEDERKAQELFLRLILLYGFVVRYKKEEELF